MPPPKIQSYDGLVTLELLFSTTRDYALQFSFPLNDQNEWKEREIGLIALSMLQDQEATPAPILEIVKYFCERRIGTHPRESSEMSRTEEFLETFVPAIQEEASDFLFSALAVLKTHFDKMQSILKSRPTVTSQESITILTAEIAEHSQSIEATVWSGEAFERDPTTCVYLCPFKMRRLMRRVKRLFQVPLPTDTIFEKTALKITLKSEPTTVNFGLTKEQFFIETPSSLHVIPNSSIARIHARRPNNTGVEIYLRTGVSYLLDFQTIDAYAFARIVRRAEIPNCRVVPRPDLFPSSNLQARWVAGEISSFEYLAKLNVIDGRSFHDRAAYPFFPAILDDFDDLRSSRIAATVPPLDISLPIRDAFARGVLPADFFFRAESVTELPHWVGSPADFVHKMRRLLEAPGTSARLHRWLTVAFARLLGNRSHPPRKPAPGGLSAPRFGLADLADRTIRAAVHVGNSSFLVVLVDGTLGTISFAVENSVRVTFTQKAGQVPSDVSYTATERKLAALQSDRCLVTVVDDRKPITQVTVYADTDIVWPIRDDLIFCPDAASVACLALRSGGVRPLTPAFARIVRIAADPVFRIVAIATIDGDIHICDLTTGQLVRSTTAGGEVALLAITPKWGDVVALARGSIFVMNVNGVVLRRAEAAYPMSAWFPFSSLSDFDFVAFVTDEGTMGLFEPLMPDRAWPFHEGGARVLAVSFDKALRALVLLGQRGEVHVVPHPLFA
jgi:hypothetical protein